MIAPIPFICLEGHECAKEKIKNKNFILSNMGDTLGGEGVPTDP